MSGLTVSSLLTFVCCIIKLGLKFPMMSLIFFFLCSFPKTEKGQAFFF